MTYTIYGKPGCTYCNAAINILETYNHNYTYVDIVEENLVDWIKGQGFTTVPQIFYIRGTDEEHIGGYQELVRHLRKIHS